MTIDPASLQILHYPHTALRTKAEVVPDVDEQVRAVAQRMVELMREAEGVGLAAPQVGLSWRLFVAEVPPGEDRSVDAEPRTATLGHEVFINPRIVAFEGDLEGAEEGCLSIPGVTGEVRRPPQVIIEAVDLDGEPFALSSAGLLSRCLQHEVDHLDGVLILDRMTQMSRLKTRSAIKALEKQASSR